MRNEGGLRLQEYLQRRTGGRAGWQAALARAAKVRPATLSDWFSGQSTPHLEHLYRVAVAVGVRPHELVAAWFGDEVEVVAAPEDAAELERLIQQATSQALRQWQGLPPAPPDSEGEAG